MGDLQNKRVIVTKGLLFLLLIALSAGAVFCLAPAWRTLLLLAVLIWASARFYYFLFYVLHTYVDPRYQYAGLLALARSILQKKADDKSPGPENPKP
ncbi:MAG: hypothetical protein JW741_24525 [Sedimentisphaerales bacterium]|nr:hypothetical protein [Sedimentisphaerales bacterium]